MPYTAESLYFETSVSTVKSIGGSVVLPSIAFAIEASMLKPYSQEMSLDRSPLGYLTIGSAQLFPAMTSAGEANFFLPWPMALDIDITPLTYKSTKITGTIPSPVFRGLAENPVGMPGVFILPTLASAIETFIPDAYAMQWTLPVITSEVTPLQDVYFLDGDYLFLPELKSEIYLGANQEIFFNFDLPKVVGDIATIQDLALRIEANLQTIASEIVTIQNLALESAYTLPLISAALETSQDLHWNSASVLPRIKMEWIGGSEEPAKVELRLSLLQSQVLTKQDSWLTVDSVLRPIDNEILVGNGLAVFVTKDGYKLPTMTSGIATIQDLWIGSPVVLPAITSAATGEQGKYWGSVVDLPKISSDMQIADTLEIDVRYTLRRIESKTFVGTPGFIFRTLRNIRGFYYRLGFGF